MKIKAARVFACILSAVGRTGIGPVLTADVCNTLAINGLSKRLQHSVRRGGVHPHPRRFGAFAAHWIFPVSRYVYNWLDAKIVMLFEV